MGRFILPTAGTINRMAGNLAERHCEACRPGTPTLPKDQADRLLGQTPEWKVEELGGHLQLTRTFKFKGFLPGVDLIDRIAPIAEQEGHHPDLHLTYGALTVTLWTHVAGGLTDNDFILAAKIDQIRPR